MNTLAFDIQSPKDFFNKLVEDFDEFKKSDNSSRSALNCAMTAWHLTDWIYHNYGLNKKFSKLKNYQAHIKELCPSLQVIHDIANGSRHFKLEYHRPKIETTEKDEGVFDNTFDFTFDRAMLKIIMKNGDILIFDDVMTNSISFWKDYILEIDKANNNE